MKCEQPSFSGRIPIFALSMSPFFQREAQNQALAPTQGLNRRGFKEEHTRGGLPPTAGGSQIFFLLFPPKKCVFSFWCSVKTTKKGVPGKPVRTRLDSQWFWTLPQVEPPLAKSAWRRYRRRGCQEPAGRSQRLPLVWEHLPGCMGVSCCEGTLLLRFLKGNQEGQPHFSQGPLNKNTPKYQLLSNLWFGLVVSRCSGVRSSSG